MHQRQRDRRLGRRDVPCCRGRARRPSYYALHRLSDAAHAILHFALCTLHFSLDPNLPTVVYPLLSTVSWTQTVNPEPFRADTARL